MIKINTIVGKNLKIFTRSKMSALIMFLIPLLIVFLVGTAFSSNAISGIKVGSYSEEYSSISENILDNLRESEISIINYEDLESCVVGVKNGNVHVCIVFPKDMQIKDSGENVIFYVDNSRVNIAYSLINKIDKIISLEAESLGLTVAERVIAFVKDVDKSLPIQKQKISSASDKLKQANEKIASSQSSMPNLDSIISDLESAKVYVDSLEDSGASSTKTKINSAISSLKSAKSSQTGAGAQLDSAKNDLINAQSETNEAIKEIDRLTKEVLSVKDSNAENIISPIKSEVSLLHENESNWKFLFPTLVSLMVLFSSVILASNLVAKDKRSKSYFRNFITPASDFSFIIGMCLTCLIILIVQLIILFSGSFILTDLEFDKIIFSLIFVLLISSPTFIFLGMFIGYIFKSEETAILTSLSVAFILMFFSNTIFPMETISGAFRYVAEYNPFVLTEYILKQTILFQSSLSSLQFKFYILIGQMIGLFVMVYLARKATKRFI